MPHFSLSGSTPCSTPAWRIHNSARDGSGAPKQLLELGPDALGRKLVDAVLQPGAGLQPLGVGPAGAIPGEEAEEAQDAQIVLADARFRDRR